MADSDYRRQQSPAGQVAVDFHDGKVDINSNIKLGDVKPPLHPDATAQEKKAYEASEPVRTWTALTKILGSIVYGTLPRAVYSYAMFLISLVVSYVVLGNLDMDFLDEKVSWPADAQLFVKRVVIGFFAGMLLWQISVILFLVKGTRDHAEGEAVESNDKTVNTGGFKEAYVALAKGTRPFHVAVALSFVGCIIATIVGIITMLEGVDRGVVAIIALLNIDTTFNFAGHIRSQIDAQKFTVSLDYAPSMLRGVLTGTTAKTIYSVGMFLVSLVASFVMIFLLNTGAISSETTWTIKFLLYGYFIVAFLMMLLAILFVAKMVRNRQEAMAIQTHGQGTKYYNENLFKSLYDTNLYHGVVWFGFTVAIVAVIIGIAVMVRGIDRGITGIITLMLFDSTFNLIMHIRNKIDATKY
jgi:hypothetical protein